MCYRSIQVCKSRAIQRAPAVAALQQKQLDKGRMKTVDMASTAGILFDLLFETSFCFLSSP
jgi:hypothetical protein